MSDIISQIVKWSGNRPAWQRDALRRLALEEDAHLDTDYFIACCLSAHGIADDPGMEPICSEHIASVPDDAPPVRITSIGSLANVNALKNGQELTVATEGLTLIYGGNGTGKSGFMRVLKQVCRARGGAPAVHANAFRDGGGAPSARISYKVGDDDYQCDWKTGVAAPVELSAVSTFDTHSAAVYISQSNEMAYVPSGLNLLERLSAICDKVAHAIEQRKVALAADRVQLPDVTLLTPLANLLDSLGIGGSVEAVRKHATLSPEESKRLIELRCLRAKLDADDSQKRALEIRRQAERISAAQKRFATATAYLADEAIIAYRKAHDGYQAAERAAELASSDAFTGEPIKGVGSEEWNVLWKAARAFSESQAHPGRTFPVTGDACLLCHQPLGSDASTRLQRFEDFVKDETRAQADGARKRRDAARDHLDRANVDAILDETLATELNDLDTDAADALYAAISALRGRCDTTTPSGGAEWAPLLPLSPFPEDLVRLAASKLVEAENMTKVMDAEARAVIDSEYVMLNDRATIAGALGDVEAEHQRRQQIARLEDSRGDTHTNGISKFARSLTESAATEKVVAQFHHELASLGLGKIEARIESKGAKKGKALHQLALPTLDEATAKVDEILSEGERRCAALAALLAEISLQESASTLVLDDPCSSLDHRRREHMARRIVSLASERPVVVFTHDLVFLLDVQDEASVQNVSVTERRLTTLSGLGVAMEGFPFKGAKPKQRVGVLKQEVIRLKKVYETDTDVYDSSVASWYGRLRETWERAVEEVMLNGAVKRFGREIKTGNLRRIANLEQRHVDAMEEGMTKSSRWLPGHDESPADASDTPAPDELQADIDALDDWIREVNKIHN